MTHPTPDNFIIVDGGLVQNDPALPVFDMDCIRDTPIEGQIDEALDLLRRMIDHDADTLKHYINQVKDYILVYGDEEQCEECQGMMTHLKEKNGNHVI